MSIVILDFGSQYTPLIARRLRELRVYSVVLPGTSPVEEICTQEPQALIFSGGPASIFDSDAPLPDPRVYDLDIPILGICYGMYLLAQHFEGQMKQIGRREYGKALLTHCEGPLFAGFPGETQVWMSHSGTVTALPSGWRVVAATKENPLAAIESPDARYFGVQFHPEVVHTVEGRLMLENFLQAMKIPRDWAPERTLELLVQEVKEKVGSGRVLLALSGGVDSSTLALLLTHAGIEHIAVFVDHGLLRQGERAEVEQALHALGVNVITVDAAAQFIQALQGVWDPEEKRKIIGQEFITVLREKAREYGPFQFLAQGTLCPDVIESAGGAGTASIKSHHNVGGLPKELVFKLLEPLRFLFKDEVRELARLLGLADAIRLRHPFPGPGLAIRILGEVTQEKLEVLRRADAIFIEALRMTNLYQDVWQALAVLAPCRSVGVMGDERHYGYVLALRAVTGVDGMTADWARLPAEFLDKVARKITCQVPEVGRVVYDITSKPPATIEWE